MNSLLIRINNLPRFHTRNNPCRYDPFRSESASSSITTSSSLSSFFISSCHSHSFHRSFSTSLSTSTTPAIVFDIDGVLVRGSSPLPTAAHALRLLHRQRDFRSGRVLPFAFLTNGGGFTEAKRAAMIQDMLEGVQVDGQDVILSHTPMRALVSRYGGSKGQGGSGKAVVIVGKRDCVEIARLYGFDNAISTADLGALIHPKALPVEMQSSVHEVHQYSLQELQALHELVRRDVAAILVMHDSTNWGQDIQLLCDILASDGTFHRNRVDKQVVPIYFSNEDFHFPNEYTHPRFAQGAFKLALKAVYNKMTGRDLVYSQFGKPYKLQYDHMEEVIHRQAHSLGFEGVNVIYAIGDNPQADVRGAKNAGDPWVSILVKTGCWQGEGNDSQDPAHVVVEHVADAVEYVLKKHNIN